MTAELQVVIFLICLISLDLYIITDKICTAWIKTARLDNGFDEDGGTKFLGDKAIDIRWLKRQQADKKDKI